MNRIHHLWLVIPFFLLLSPVFQARADMLLFSPALLAASRNITGQWDLDLTVTADGSEMSMSIGILQDGGSFEICWVNRRDEGLKEGSGVSFSLEDYSFSGTISSRNSMSGTWDQGTWSLSRTGASPFCPDIGVWNVGGPLPQFVVHDFTELSKILRISRFRSGMGHDYSDDYETCRSMKHYYEPSVAAEEWGDIKVYSPVDGQIIAIQEEWAGKQLHILSSDQPAFSFVLFHVDLDPSLAVGSSVAGGQQIGTHIGSQTMQDIAVKVNVEDGDKEELLVSYFDVMNDSLFADYVDFAADRSDFIISKGERDADPLTCDGETFQDYGTIENWVTRK